MLRSAYSTEPCWRDMVGPNLGRTLIFLTSINKSSAIIGKLAGFGGEVLMISEAKFVSSQDGAFDILTALHKFCNKEEKTDISLIGDSVGAISLGSKPVAISTDAIQMIIEL